VIKLERLIIQSKPVTFVRNLARRKTLPGLQGLSVYDVWHFFFIRTKKVGINERAATISFNMVMAIPATTIFLFTLLPYLPVSKQLYREMMVFVRDISPNLQTRQFIVGFLNDFFNTPKKGLLSLGFVLALFYSSNAMMGIIRTFDRSLVEKHHSNFFHKRLRAIGLILILILIFIGTTLISFGQGQLFIFVLKKLKITNGHAKAWIQNLRWIVIVLLFLYSIAFIYKYAPSVKKRWKLLSTGAVFATLLIVVLTWLFSIWAQNFSNYNRLYGSIGTVLMIMMLIRLNSYILLVGYELNITIQTLKGEANGQLQNA